MPGQGSSLAGILGLEGMAPPPRHPNAPPPLQPILDEQERARKELMYAKYINAMRKLAGDPPLYDTDTPPGRGGPGGPDPSRGDTGSDSGKIPPNPAPQDPERFMPGGEMDFRGGGPVSRAGTLWPDARGPVGDATLWPDVQGTRDPRHEPRQPQPKEEYAPDILDYIFGSWDDPTGPRPPQWPDYPVPPHPNPQPAPPPPPPRPFGPAGD